MKVSIRKTFMADAISLIDVFRLFYDRKLYIVIGIGISTIIGFIVAKTSPEEYEAVVEVLGEEGLEGSSAGFDILGLATRSLRQPQVSSGGLGMDMFPKIITTSPFLVELMDEEFKFKGIKKPISLYEYFLQPQPKHFFSEAKDYLKDLPNNLKILVGLAKEKKKKIPPHVRKTVRGYPDIMLVSPEEKRVIAELSKRISISNSGRVVILSVKMPDPDVAAKLNTIVISKLIDYVVEYKIGKLKKDLEFVRARKQEAEVNYKEAQKQLAVFRDSNQGRTTRLAETTEQRLQFEYQLASGIYNTLSNQLVQSEIQIKKETPLFSRLEPVSIPATPSEPVVKKTVILYAGLGAVLGFIFIVGHIVFGFFRENETDGVLNESAGLTDQKIQ